MDGLCSMESVVLWYHARHICSHLFYSVWVSGLTAVEKHGQKWLI